MQSMRLIFVFFYGAAWGKEWMTRKFVKIVLTNKVVNAMLFMTRKVVKTLSVTGNRKQMTKHNNEKRQEMIMCPYTII